MGDFDKFKSKHHYNICKLLSFKKRLMIKVVILQIIDWEAIILFNSFPPADHCSR